MMDIVVSRYHLFSQVPTYPGDGANLGVLVVRIVLAAALTMVDSNTQGNTEEVRSLGE